MKILVVGATGTIGAAVSDALEPRHEVLRASRGGEVRVDITKPESIIEMYEAVGEVDAVVSAAGTGKFGPLDEVTDDDFAFGFSRKVMGQVGLVRHGRRFVSDGGSFTLVSGTMAHEPSAGAVLIGVLNSGIEAFVRGMALDMPRGQRINAVCPPPVRETAEKLGWGSDGMPVAEVAQLFVQSVEGNETGRLIGPFHEE